MSNESGVFFGSESSYIDTEAHLEGSDLSTQLMWLGIDTAPRDGEEFQAWIKADNCDGFWAPRCRYNEHGVFGIYGCVDYDIYGWDYGLIHLTPTHWMSQPISPYNKIEEKEYVK
jgi:hypothetical protein